MDERQIVEIGARVLFEDTQVGRWKLYGYAQKQWGDEPESEKRCIRQMRAALAAFEEAGLVLIDRQTLIDAAEIVGSINVEGNQRLASALRAAAKADPQ